jgi:hypothetical protein
MWFAKALGDFFGETSEIMIKEFCAPIQHHLEGIKDRRPEREIIEAEAMFYLLRSEAHVAS